MLNLKRGFLAVVFLFATFSPSSAQTAADSSSSQLLKPEQLEALVAPIALILAGHSAPSLSRPAHG